MKYYCSTPPELGPTVSKTPAKVAFEFVRGKLKKVGYYETQSGSFVCQIIK